MAILPMAILGITTRKWVRCNWSNRMFMGKPVIPAVEASGAAGASFVSSKGIRQ